MSPLEGKHTFPARLDRYACEMGVSGVMSTTDKKFFRAILSQETLIIDKLFAVIDRKWTTKPAVKSWIKHEQ